MANHDVLLGQNNSGALGHSQPVVLNRNHNMAIAQTHGLEMGQPHEQEARLGQSHDNQGDDDHEYEQENRLTMEEKPEHEVQDVHLHGGSSELDMSDHNELAVSETQELDENMELAVIQHEDMEFPDVKACRRALRDTAIALHFEMQTIKSDKTRFTAKCASEGCPWRIHAAKLPGVPTFTIRTINDNHTCGGIAHLGHQQASVQWVANSVEQRLRENPNYKPKRNPGRNS
ncbi:UNVERIFIED_CONTAM: hypothetical protein Sradi_4762600 [Sesamum radiatum]|uniref:Transposase MuDR plant domain-containing protein n=1 Tax=Sesamum radiatum TaxID=300843 RepID=A0AAW2MV38_SESRA